MVQVEVQLTFQEYVAVQRHFSRYADGFFKFLGWLGLILFVLMPWWMPAEKPGASSWWEVYSHQPGGLILPALFLGVFPLLKQNAFSKRWKASPELGERRIFIFEESGIETRSALSGSSTTWGLYKKAQFAAQSIVLVTGQNIIVIIPNSAWHNGAELEEFKKLVRSKVADCSKLK